MNFLSWLFNVKKRHMGGMRRYEKGGILARIFIIVLMLLLIGGTVAIELWCLQLLESNFLLAIFAILFLFIPITGTAIEFCAVYSFYGFRMAIWGAINSIAEKIDDEPIKKEKKYKKLDIFIGFLGLVLAFGLIFLIIYIFVK
ncbi:MAG: hypothetical protein ACI35S_01320 [Anaeroplasma sp.]